MRARRQRITDRSIRTFNLPLGVTALVVFATFSPETEVGAEAPEPRFTEVSRELGVDFTHRHFGTGEKFMPENMSPGVAVFDFDGDGLLDIYLVQGTTLVGDPPEPLPSNILLRQVPEGGFVDFTTRSGAGDPGYGVGTSYGDYDRDGDPDLYVTNFGRNTLLRNQGDGTFEDVTAEAGVECPLWSVSAGFFDPDHDGDLDLYAANYLDFAFDNHKFCGNAQSGVRAYCHPDVYNSIPDCFFRNEGDGRFTAVGSEVGIILTLDSVGLGVSFADLDGDGNQDIYVANDAVMNHLYLGDGTGRFTESALLAGVGFNADGIPESSMGIEIGDLDGDGLADIYLTHLDEQTNTLYRNLGQGMFMDVTDSAGLGAPSLPWVGFGTVFFDHDNDGDLDIFVTNGHIIDNIELFDASRAYKQPLQLYDNQGDGTFIEISEALGVDEFLVGRGAVGADLDRDGDLDIVMMQNDGRTLILENRTQTTAVHIRIRLLASQSNLEGFGSRLELTVGGKRQLRLARSAISYASQAPAEIHFGTGHATRVDSLELTWPSGRRVRYRDLTTGALYTLYEKSDAGDTPTPPD
jgi:hypothetical protein